MVIRAFTAFNGGHAYVMIFMAFWQEKALCDGLLKTKNQPFLRFPQTPVVRTGNMSIVSLRFHKVGSTTMREVMTLLEHSFSEHSSLLAYQNGGITGLRCIGAPQLKQVAFIALVRDPVARVLSTLSYYSAFMPFDDVKSIVRATPCSNYSAALIEKLFLRMSSGPHFNSIMEGLTLNLYSKTHWQGIVGYQTDAALHSNGPAKTTKDRHGNLAGERCYLL